MLVLPTQICRLTSRAALLGALLAGLFTGLAGPASATPKLLVDVTSGRVLHEEDATQPWFPASVTKLMTTYVALVQMREGRVRPETLITYSALAQAQDPSKMGFKEGAQFTLENALRMLMVKSANDVAVAIAESLGGSVEGFVAEMNRHAQRLGMTGTHWANPHGLPDPEQVTTARDMAILARALIRDFPQADGLFRIPAIKLGKIFMRNHNALLHRYEGADGMKTGFICSAGFNVVASARRDGKRLIAVVFGASSGSERAEIAAGLFNAGFQPSLRFFGAPPTVDSLQNVAGAPPDLRETVCGRNRKRPAESEDDGPPLANSGDPNEVYAVHRDSRPALRGANGVTVDRPTNLAAHVVGAPVAVYLGPSRGDTMLAGLAPANPVATVVAPARVAVPRPIAPPAAPGQIAPGPQRATASAFAPAAPAGGFRGAAPPPATPIAVPIPRPRPRS